MTRWIRSQCRFLVLFTSCLVASVLGGCDGGLFGTGTGDNEMIGTAATADSSTPGMNPTESEEAPEAPAGSPPDHSTGADSQPIDMAFSNTTPSGISQQNTALPAIKLINLTDTAITMAVIQGQSISAGASSTSELLSVKTGETTVSLRRADNDLVVASLNPLNAVEDSLTTLIIDTVASENVVLAIDTQAVVTAQGMAQLRIVSVNPSNSNQFTLTPTQSNAEGVELVLSNANDENAAVGVYTLASTGEYSLSTENARFPPQLVTLAADTVYTIVITNNPQLPVYVEVDSLLGE